MPRTHVYRHFEGKPALDLAVSAHVANQIGEQIRAGLAARARPARSSAPPSTST